MVKIEAWIRLYGPECLIVLMLLADLMSGMQGFQWGIQLPVLYLWTYRQNRTVFSQGDHLLMGAWLIALSFLFGRFDPVFLLLQLGTKGLMAMAFSARLPVRSKIRKALDGFTQENGLTSAMINQSGSRLVRSDGREVWFKGPLRSTEITWCAYRLCLSQPGSPVLIEDYRDPDDVRPGKQILVIWH